MVLFLMRNFVLKFALPILICNVLFIYIGFVANIGFVGSFAGGLMAIGTDPIIIMIGVLLGVLTVFKQLNFSLIYFNSRRCSFNCSYSFYFRNYKIYWLI